MEICLIRHGQTDANKNSIIQGRADNPLNNTGRKQALQTAEYLIKKELDFDYCLSSPLERAIETGEIILKEMDLNLKINTEEEITERDFGDYDGKKIKDGYFKAVHDGLIPGMETDQEIENRVKNFFINFFKNNQYKRVLMLAHSHVIKALLVQYLPSFEYDTYLNNCSINILDFDSDIKVLDYNINPLKESKNNI